MTPAEFVLVCLIGLATASLALWLFSRESRRAVSALSEQSEPISFLFEGEDLVDVSDEGKALLDTVGARHTLKDIIALFRSRFAIPDAPTPAQDDQAEFSFPPISPGDDGLLRISRDNRKTRIDLACNGQSGTAMAHKLFLVQTELSKLQKANDVTPCPIWHANKDGRVVWHNKAYGRLYERVLEAAPDADQPLFQLEPDSRLPGRVMLQAAESTQRMNFEVTRSETADGAFYVAVDSNAVVHAEMAQRNFVQTLAKTFAHLSIGLAIFNDERQLILFNPALVDLTDLSAEFLSARPYLLSFFDELRNKRTMPEPKNYNSWRQQIADLVAAASDGRYSEIWSLDNGRTYRVNGRPHPDGAIAFLFEDISAEVSLTRRFRAELELGQSVIDSLDSGIVVFSSSGVLTISNNAYSEMWKVDPDHSFADVTIIDAMRDWQENSAPSPIWGELRDFVLDFQDRVSWTTNVPGPSGTELACEVVPLSSGATMVKFTPENTMAVSKTKKTGSKKV